MASKTLLALRRPLLLHRHSPAPAARRLASDWSHLQTELPARKIPLSYDYLTPTHSHLLNIAVADYLPTTAAASSSPRILPNTAEPSPLPPTHHLVYFPPAIPAGELLADGTDPLQSPGAPFIRRMWAGGSVRFNTTKAAADLLALDGRRAVCVESLKDVSIKGKDGDEKIFVGIERRVGRCAEREDEESIRERLGANGEDDAFGEAGVIERRNIVFMRERSREQAAKDMEKAKEKKMEPPHSDPDFVHEVLPDAKLLFRYSALTYNAHAIHLDVAYCKEVEGHRERLVHGPLSFTLMMTMLRKHLAGTTGEEVASVEYRNLSPLYNGEPLKLAGKQKEKGKWDVWVETPEGGVGVKGTVKTVDGKARERGYGDLAMMGDC